MKTANWLLAIVFLTSSLVVSAIVIAIKMGIYFETLEAILSYFQNQADVVSVGLWWATSGIMFSVTLVYFSGTALLKVASDYWRKPAR